MKAGQKKYYFGKSRKLLASLLLMSLLLLLTGMNFFIYGNNGIENAQVFANDWSGDEDSPVNPAGPDEKPPGNPISFNEEYVHEPGSMPDPYWSLLFFKYMIAGSEKLDWVHFEILSPPPELG